MMERLVSNRPAGARRRTELLIRDVYGAYHQCLQCSREVEPAAAVAPLHTATTVLPVGPQMDELRVA